MTEPEESKVPTVWQAAQAGHPDAIRMVLEFLKDLLSEYEYMQDRNRKFLEENKEFPVPGSRLFLLGLNSHYANEADRIRTDIEEWEAKLK